MADPVEQDIDRWNDDEARSVIAHELWEEKIKDECKQIELETFTEALSNADDKDYELLHRAKTDIEKSVALDILLRNYIIYLNPEF